ncbi:MAG: protein-L-isoaspartate O-methyltransferase family protein [Pseudonocardiaceae bacterium]
MEDRELTVRGRELGAGLRDAMEGAGLNGREAGHLLGWSESWMSLRSSGHAGSRTPSGTGCSGCAGHAQSGFVALSKHDHPQRWRELVGGNEPVITQVDEGHTAASDTGRSPSSSCSKPSIVAGMLDALDVCPGHAVLEIGTGSGWNAALLCRRVGTRGRVVSIDVDPVIAEAARAALASAGYSPLMITGDGVEGHPDGAPYDRVVVTAAVREIVPGPGWSKPGLVVALSCRGEPTIATASC